VEDKVEDEVNRKTRIKRGRVLRCLLGITASLVRSSFELVIHQRRERIISCFAPGAWNMTLSRKTYDRWFPSESQSRADDRWDEARRRELELLVLVCGVALEVELFPEEIEDSGSR